MNFLQNFLFNDNIEKRPRILLVIFLLLATSATIYIAKNPNNFINYPNTGIALNLGNLSPEELAILDPNTAPEQKEAAKTTIKKTKEETNSTTQSTSSTSSSNSPSDSNSDSDTPAPESISAYVAYYADNQSDSDGEDAIHQSVVNKILGTSADPVFHGGDLMEDGTQNSLDRFNNVAGSMLSTRTFYGSLGNNDRNGSDTTTPSPLYLANFSFPNNERWYSVNSGNLHMVVLDSAFAASDPTQLAWLASDLQSAASQSRITGVIFHHPTFSSTINSYLVNYGVDFVVSGHIHTYSKTISDGISYFTLPGGSSLGYATASIYQSYGQFKTYDTSGNLIENARINSR